MTITNDFNKLLFYEDFETASKETLTFLQEKLAFKLWMITRTEGNDWIILHAKDQYYNVDAGEVLSWSDSFCARMLQGEGPQIAPDSDQIVAYKQAPIAQKMPIGAYIGIPLFKKQGELFGTLCAIDPKPQADSIAQLEPWLEIIGKLLSSLLHHEMKIEETNRALERSKALSFYDTATGLYNQYGWNILVTTEERLCKKFGNPAIVILVKVSKPSDNIRYNSLENFIQVAAACLKSSIRSQDILAYINPDEFNILLINFRKDQITEYIQRIRNKFELMHIHGEIGWAMRDPKTDLYTAMDTARQALKKELL